MAEYFDNYILSKIIGENLIGSSSVIIRPSIISPSWNFPNPGWGGKKQSTITAIVSCVSSRLLRNSLKTSFNSILPVTIVPVDFVTKSIIENLDSINGTIKLAAVNTNCKNKLYNWDGLHSTIASYLFSIEISSQLFNIEVNAKNASPEPIVSTISVLYDLYCIVLLPS